MSQQAGSDPKPFLIDGEWISHSVESFESVNPATGEVNFRVSTALREHVDAAVASARTAAKLAAWKDMLPHMRAQILMRIASLITEREDEFSRAQMLENGNGGGGGQAQGGSGAAT